MAFTLTELFSIGGGNITLATGLGASTGEVYAGVGDKLYKRNVGETTWNQYYVSTNRANVIPFFLNGAICIAEFDDFENTGTPENVTLRTNLLQQSSNSFGFGDVIGVINSIYKIQGILSTNNGKAVFSVEKLISGSTACRLFETDGTLSTSELTELQTPDLAAGAIQDTTLTYTSTSVGNGLINISSYYFTQQSDALLCFTYDGVSFVNLYEGSARQNNQDLFGSHVVNGENRIFGIGNGLSLYSYDSNGNLTALFANDQLLQSSDYNPNSFRMANVVQDDDYVYLFTKEYFGNSSSNLFRYKKTDFTTDKLSFTERTHLLQFNSAFEGIGIGDTFFSMQVPETPPEPSQQAPRLIYPKSNPIRFVKLQTYNPTSNPKNINNTLYCDLRHNNITNAFFAQPYLKSDIPEIQFLSNVETDGISLELLDKDGDFVKDLTVEKRVDVLGQVLQFSVTLTIDQNTGNPVMLFGGDGKIPSGLEPESGNSILIENSGDVNLDGLYFITNVLLGSGADPDKIFFNYQGVISGSPSADVTFFEGAGTNNVYNGIIDAQDQPNGYYKLKLTITGQGESLIFNSELLLIKDVFEEDETILIEYSNNDKFFRIDYGVTPPMKIRAWARFFYQKPGSDKTLMQDSDFDDVIIRATPSNTITLNIFESPFYFHRILNLVFSHDIVKVQGLAITNGNEYSIESLSDIYSLSNGKIELKEKDYADEYNEIDSGISGDIDETGVIGSNDGLLGY